MSVTSCGTHFLFNINDCFNITVKSLSKLLNFFFRIRGCFRQYHERIISNRSNLNLEGLNADVLVSGLACPNTLIIIFSEQWVIIEPFIYSIVLALALSEKWYSELQLADKIFAYVLDETKTC